LRREEVATLAGISPDYYLRIEQGRDHTLSDQVLASLARALRLNELETRYLIRLARPELHALAAEPRPLSPAVVTLLDQWSHTPAYVFDRNLDVLAANQLMLDLAPAIVAPGTNLVETVAAGYATSGRLHSIRWSRHCGTTPIRKIRVCKKSSVPSRSDIKISGKCGHCTMLTPTHPERIARGLNRWGGWTFAGRRLNCRATPGGLSSLIWPNRDHERMQLFHTSRRPELLRPREWCSYRHGLTEPLDPSAAARRSSASFDSSSTVPKRISVSSKFSGTRVRW
jgi:transcriptional regulator with XRE-family HTH domain